MKSFIHHFAANHLESHHPIKPHIHVKAHSNNVGYKHVLDGGSSRNIWDNFLFGYATAKFLHEFEVPSLLFTTLQEAYFSPQALAMYAPFAATPALIV